MNHFYGHSMALARYALLARPRHIPGLVQHGWTAGSPLDTHFRDLPEVGAPGSRRRLFVWSHHTRAYDPAATPRPTVPIGAPWLYLAVQLGGLEVKRSGPDADSPELTVSLAAGSGTVIMPVHGIETQRVRGDHAAVARRWAEIEGPSTVCLYQADTRDPRIVAAYRDAGHTLVTLGARHDGAFLWRLYTLLAGARRVVSNRLSTPIMYAAVLGREIGVYGAALRVDGESETAYEPVRATWPELHGERVDSVVAAALAAAELGVPHLLGRAELRATLGWNHPEPGPAAQYWTTSPLARARVNLTRRRGASRRPLVASPPTTPAPGSPASASTASVSAAAWLRGALSYLPRPLPRRVPRAGEPPLVVG